MRRWVIVSIVAAAMVLVGVGATLLVLRADPGKTTLSGELRIVGMDNIAGSNLDCYGKGGYGELHEGANVVITDASGTTVAVTSLRAGGWVHEYGITFCKLPFSVSVPSGKDFYGVEVAHRGRVQFPESQLRSVILSIGS